MNLLLLIVFLFTLNLAVSQEKFYPFNQAREEPSDQSSTRKLHDSLKNILTESTKSLNKQHKQNQKVIQAAKEKRKGKIKRLVLVC